MTESPSDNLAGSPDEFNDAVTRKMTADAEKARQQAKREESKKASEDTDAAEGTEDAAGGELVDGQADPAENAGDAAVAEGDTGEDREDQPALETDENSPAEEAEPSS